MDGTGKYKMVDEIHKKGRAKLEWLNENKLTIQSRPLQWFMAAMKTDQRGASGKRKSLFELWCTWSNAKAMLMNAGEEGSVYPTWKKFTVAQIQKEVGLHILNGINISPRIEYKFRSQSNDPISGNDLCANAFGENAELRHREFKCFFSIQDPLVATPSRKTHPNHKVDHFFQHINKFSHESWELGSSFACDEQDIAFQGRHKDKQTIKFKKAGDGFLFDSLAEDGFTYSFYPRNAPPPKKWMDEGFSPTHSRVLFMLDQITGHNRVCYMDNLFGAVKLAKAAYSKLRSRIMIHGPCRTEVWRGLPRMIIQKEVTADRDLRQARGTTKAAVLEGDPDCPDLIACSVYDTKPVHFLTNSVQFVRWIKCKKRVYDPRKKEMVWNEFLRTNLQDDYNNGMDDVDVSDQLRTIYRFDYWLRNQKWWWAMWMWGVSVVIVNVYVLYVASHVLIWKQDKSKLISHYEFRKDISLGLIDPDTYMKLNGGVAVGEEVSDISVSDISTNTSSTRRTGISTRSSKPEKAPYVNDASLNPLHGKLKIRLDHTQEHFPNDDVRQTYTLCCALHRWASSDGRQKRERVEVCTSCKVALCMSCFRKFHVVEDVTKLKTLVQRVIDSEKEP